LVLILVFLTAFSLDEVLILQVKFEDGQSWDLKS